MKTLQPLASENDKVKFLQEAAIMGQFLHPNVVKLFGVVTVGEPVSIIADTQKHTQRHFMTLPHTHTHTHTRTCTHTHTHTQTGYDSIGIHAKGRLKKLSSLQTATVSAALKYQHLDYNIYLT